MNRCAWMVAAAAALAEVGFAQTTYKLSGTVTAAGRSIPNTTIEIRYGSSQTPDVVTSTDGNGTFQTTVNGGGINLNVVPPVESALLSESMSLTMSRDTVAKLVVYPPVTIDITGRAPGTFTEQIDVYSLTTSRSFHGGTQDGHLVLNVPPDIYSVHASHRDTSFYFGRTTVDLRDGRAKSVVIQAERDTPITTTLPPKCALIHISAPDANGMATISGDAGACDPLATVAVVNAQTHEAAITLSGSDGSFSLSMFAPPGSTLHIKHDPSGRYLPDLNLSGGTNTGIEVAPGTLIDVPADSGQFSVTSLINVFANDSDLHLRQYAAIGSQDAGRWWLTGSMPGRSWSAGQSITLTGKLKMYAKAIASTTLSNIKLNPSMKLERLFDADGIEREGSMQFVSSFMTPTGFPIERESNDLTVVIPTITGLKIVDGHIEGDWSASFRVPTTIPAGVYRPSFTLNVTGLEPNQRYYDVLPTPEGEYFGRLGGFPLVQIGSPTPPRLFWLLGLDTFTNGGRGTVAIEDQSQVGFTSHVMTNPKTLVLPMRDARSGTPFRYRLEPYVPLVDKTFSRIAHATRIPFKFPSGSLSVKVTRPDGSIDDLGSVAFAQSMTHTITTRSGIPISGATSHVTDFMQLTTLDPRFDYTFTQYGLHRIEMKGSIEDIYGNLYEGGGTYEIHVARPIDFETAVIAGTPFESGNVFASQVTLQPPVPADVSVVITHLPDSDPARMQRSTAEGRANRFGFFNPDTPIRMNGAGEYRADITAQYTDVTGTQWMGTASFGSVVETPSSPLVVHGRRGFDGVNAIQQQWFTVRQARAGGDHVMFPFNRGDIMWMQHNDPAADIPKITIADPSGLFAQRVRDRGRIGGAPLDGPGLEERITAGEIPLFSTAVSNDLSPFVPEKAAQWGYFYGFAERPGVRIREVITEDASGNAYWRFGENYHFQLGTGINGDAQNDFKFQFGGAVWREPGFNYYGAYASLFVLLPFNDDVGGRVFPPFQGNGGGPTGGPIMTLKGKPVDIFFHPTAVRAGTILQTGEQASFAGQIGPTLPAKVNIVITSPSGAARTIQGQANKVGYFYDPLQDFTVDEPGVWKAKVNVMFDGLTSAGQVQPPYPTGDVLGSRDGEFYFYVVRGDAPPLTLAPLGQWQRPSQRAITFTIMPPLSLNNVQMTWTTAMPGFILEEGTSSALTYTYNAQILAKDFPNLDLYDADGFAGVDTITVSFLVSGTDASGTRKHFARQIVLQGEELQMPEQKETVIPARRRAVRR